MRRFISNKEFKGSVNVEFNTKEEAEEFMKKKIMFAGVEITEKELLADREKSFDEKNVATPPLLCSNRSATSTPRTACCRSATSARTRPWRRSRSS